MKKTVRQLNYEVNILVLRDIENVFFILSNFSKKSKRFTLKYNDFLLVSVPHGLHYFVSSAVVLVFFFQTQLTRRISLSLFFPRFFHQSFQNGPLFQSISSLNRGITQHYFSSRNVTRNARTSANSSAIANSCMVFD